MTYECLTCGGRRRLADGTQTPIGFFSAPCPLCGTITTHRAEKSIADKSLFYLGCIRESGHYLFGSENYKFVGVRFPRFRGMPTAWDNAAFVDGAFVPPGDGYKTSRVPPALIVSWIDNTVDTRMGSHSTFIGFGYFNAEELLDDAVIKFPAVMNRQPRPTPELI